MALTTRRGWCWGFKWIALARVEGGYQQAKVREDWRKETVDPNKGAGRRLPWFVLLSLSNGFSWSLTFFLSFFWGGPDEFAIYLNYVRKLGFEETPDYDFLRELFTKALKSTGEVEDGVYDWMLLNGGKGWEAGSVSFFFLFFFKTSLD